jgi:hypothetical protein
LLHPLNIGIKAGNTRIILFIIVSISQNRTGRSLDFFPHSTMNAPKTQYLQDGYLTAKTMVGTFLGFTNFVSITSDNAELSPIAVGLDLFYGSSGF